MTQSTDPRVAAVVARMRMWNCFELLRDGALEELASEVVAAIEKGEPRSAGALIESTNYVEPSERMIGRQPGPSRTPEEKGSHTEWRAENGEVQCVCGRPVKSGSDWCEECDCILTEPDYEYE